MDLIKQLTELFEALPDKEMVDVNVCLDAFVGYYLSVVIQQRDYLVTPIPKDECYSLLKTREKRRSEAHDAAINACSRLNELCQEVNAEKICDFDVTDRNKVAEFCGFVLSSLFYSNINCKDSVTSWLSFLQTGESGTS